jgi:serine/threonine-protein kinase
MSLSIGTRLGSYEVGALIGVGGMGEVYRAHDTKLDRDVALKVVPELFARDSDRLARFQREAKVLASLNHPNIAGIYGLEDADGVKALVLELVEGPTLADLIALRTSQTPAAAATSESQSRGAAASGTPRAFGIDEALTIAKQIVEALEAAHGLGIIHRDLKPANVKVKNDGVVKVLDFGLAKTLAPEPGSVAAAKLTQSPTITSPAAMTGVGVLLGTAAYMSPEQAKGRAADKRSDVWAFGCVLYEMLTGRRAFSGEDVPETLAGILRDAPDWSLLPASTPAAVRTLLRRCLEKDPRERLPDIGVARLEIKDALVEPPTDAVGPPRVSGRRVWQRRAAAAIIASSLAAVGGLAVWALMRPSPAKPVRLTVAPPTNVTVGNATGNSDIAISPDGTRVVFVGGLSAPGPGATPPQLYVRRLDQLEPLRLEGLVTPYSPFMSPDGNWVGFFDGPNLKKVTLNGGPAVTLCRIPAVGGTGTWAPDNTIIFSAGGSGGLFRVSAGGGEPEVLTTPDAQKGEQSHQWPEVLPGGGAVLFTVFSPATGGGGDGITNARIAVLNLKTGEQKILVTGGGYPRYVPSGHIVYGVAGTLRAVAFDLGRLEVRSDPVPVLEGVLTKSSGAADFAVAQDGSLVYLAGTQAGSIARTLVWVDRQGREEAVNAPPRAYNYPRVSPDGTRVALDIRDQENDIWVWDLTRAALTRLTFGAGLERLPLWTPDGRRIAFSSQIGASSGVPSLFWQAADGTGPVERLAESKGLQVFPTSFAPDGKRLLFWEETSSTGDDIGILPLEGERLAGPLINTKFDEQNAEVSPDGRWLAYQSNESGEYEIYVRTFPQVDGGRWQVSTGGGTRPGWARNGRELFYLVGSGKMMAVPIRPEPTFAAGSPQVLFEGQYVAAQSGRTYDVSSDGQHFLMIKNGASNRTSAPSEIIFVQHWLEELKRLVPTR